VVFDWVTPINPVVNLRQAKLEKAFEVGIKNFFPWNIVFGHPRPPRYKKFELPENSIPKNGKDKSQPWHGLYMVK
jgi:hypothetical protein